MNKIHPVRNKIHPVRNKIITISLFVILVTAILVGGFQRLTRAAIKEDIFSGNENCSLPCWNNITPAKTTRDEAVNILEKVSYINKGSIQKAGTDDLGGCIWDWKVPGGRLFPKLSWKNGITNELSLGVPFDLSVQEVISEFGPLEAVGFGEGGIPENWYWIIDMFYPQSGIQVKVYTRDFSSLIEPSTEVGAIYLFLPTSIENRISELYPNFSSESYYKLL